MQKDAIAHVDAVGQIECQRSGDRGRSRSERRVVFHANGTVEGDVDAVRERVRTAQHQPAGADFVESAGTARLADDAAQCARRAGIDIEDGGRVQQDVVGHIDAIGQIENRRPDIARDVNDSRSQCLTVLQPQRAAIEVRAARVTVGVVEDDRPQTRLGEAAGTGHDTIQGQRPRPIDDQGR